MIMFMCFGSLGLVVGYFIACTLLFGLPRGGLWIGLAGHATEVLLAGTLMGFPRGFGGVRPMGLLGLMLAVAVVCAVTGLSASMRNRQMTGTARWVGMLLSLTAFITGAVALNGVAALWGLEFAQ